MHCFRVFLFQLAHGAPPPTVGKTGRSGRSTVVLQLRGTNVHAHPRAGNPEGPWNGAPHKRGSPSPTHLSGITGILVTKCSNSILEGS